LWGVAAGVHRRGSVTRAWGLWMAVGMVVILGCAGCTSSPPAVHPTKPSPTVLHISLPWAVWARPSPRELDLAVLAGGCDDFSHVKSLQTPTTVTITVVGDRSLARGKRTLCHTDMHPTTTRLILREPLDGRRLVHAPFDSEYAGPGATKTLGYVVAACRTGHD